MRRKVMSKLVLIGSGALARETLSWFESDIKSGRYEVCGYIDQKPNPDFEKQNSIVHIGRLTDNYEVLTSKIDSDVKFVICIGNPEIRLNVTRNNSSLKFATLIHPTSTVATSAIIESGCIIGPYCSVSNDMHMKQGVMINSFVGVGHDTVIGSCTVLSSFVDICGGAQLGEAVFFGSGSRCLPGKSVASHSIVGSGAIVIRNYNKTVRILPPISTTQRI